MLKRIQTWGKVGLNWTWVENMLTSGWWWCLCGRSRCSICGCTRWKGTSSRTTSAPSKMCWPSPARKRWGNISDPRNHSLRNNRFSFNFFIRATSSSKQVKSVQHQALLEVKALIVQRYSRSEDKSQDDIFITIPLQSSGYTSSGEQRLPGVLTPPTAPPICLSIPKVLVSLDMTMISHMFPSSRTWCRTSTTSAVTLANATNSGNKLTSMYPGDNVKVCSYAFVCFKIKTIVFSRFLYSIGPRVRAVDSALQPEGPGLLHQERSQDPECFA